MKIIDITDAAKINRDPDQIISLIENGHEIYDTFEIQTIDLRSYKQHVDSTLGIFTIITVFMQTDKGSIETLYDEGYHGESALDDSVKFLTENLGLSSLILRCIISLKNKI